MLPRLFIFPSLWEMATVTSTGMDEERSPVFNVVLKNHSSTRSNRVERGKWRAAGARTTTPARRRRGCQPNADRPFPIRVGVVGRGSCRFSSPGFRWRWQVSMRPVGSSTRPFLLISFSEGESSCVSTTLTKLFRTATSPSSTLRTLRKKTHSISLPPPCILLF